jgi:hypothetical protein
MHALTFQRRATVRRAPNAVRRERFPWKWAILTAMFAAGMTWTVSAARTAWVSPAPAAPVPEVVSMVVVPVAASNNADELPEALELKRLETRNRRLEALVSVLRTRAEVHPRK